jgi:regulatory protein
MTTVAKPIQEPRSKCYFYALKYISRYPKTEKELFVKLMEKWYSSQDVDYTIAFLKSKKFLGDKMFAEMYVQSELVRKWKPKIVVQQKLYQKWVDKYLIKEVFDEMDGDIEDWILQKIQKEIAKMKARDIEWFDIIQKLLGKGYSLDQIKSVLAVKEKDI